MPLRIDGARRTPIAFFGCLLGVAIAQNGCSDSDKPADKAGAGDSKQGTPISIPAASPDAAPVAKPQVTPAAPTYGASVGGLQELMSALVDAIQEDNAGEKARLLASMRLPDAKAWFAKHFQAKAAGRLLTEYEPQSEGIGHMLSALQTPIGQGRSTITAEVFEAPDQGGATGYQQLALRSMKLRVPLYSVRFSTPDRKDNFHLWSFVHDDGTFRYVGKMKAISTSPAPAEGPDPLDFRSIDRDRFAPASP